MARHVKHFINLCLIFYNAHTVFIFIHEVSILIYNSILNINLPYTKNIVICEFIFGIIRNFNIYMFYWG